MQNSNIRGLRYQVQCRVPFQGLSIIILFIFFMKDGDLYSIKAKFLFWRAKCGAWRQNGGGLEG